MNKKLIDLLAAAVLVCAWIFAWAAADARKTAAEQAEIKRIEESKNAALRAAWDEMLNPDGSVKEEYLDEYYARIYEMNPQLKNRQYPSQSAVTDPAEVLRGQGLIWQWKLALGEIKETDPRLSLEDIRKLAGQELTFEAFAQEIKKIQQYPDYYGGSGFSHSEYWLSGTADGARLILCEDVYRFARLVIPGADGKALETVLY